MITFSLNNLCINVSQVEFYSENWEANCNEIRIKWKIKEIRLESFSLFRKKKEWIKKDTKI